MPNGFTLALAWSVASLRLGTLDAADDGRLDLGDAAIPGSFGTDLHVSSLLLDATAPEGVRSISNNVAITLR